jgi:hypothetical protein
MISVAGSDVVASFTSASLATNNAWLISIETMPATLWVCKVGGDSSVTGKHLPAPARSVNAPSFSFCFSFRGPRRLFLQAMRANLGLFISGGMGMKRWLFTGLTAMLAVAATISNLAAKPQGSAGTRLTLVPGFSLAFGRGWTACGPALARKLPAAAEAEAAQGLCRRGNTPAEARLIFLEGNTLVEMRVYVDDSFAMTEGIVRSLEPELMRRMKESVCENIAKRIAGHGKMENCQVRQQSAGGHTWIMTSFVAVSPDGGQKLPIRVAMLPYGDKILLLEFNFLAATRAQGDKIIGATIDSAALDASAVPAAPAPRAVVLTAGPGLKLSVPEGMRACDGEADALLGNAPNGAFEQRAALCEPPFNKGDFAKVEWFIVADTRTFRNVWLAIARNTGQAVTEDALVNATPERIAEASAKGCAAIARYYAESNATTEHCEAIIEEFAGRHALAAHVIATFPASPVKVAVHAFLIPLKEGQVWVLAGTPAFLESETRPAIDGIIASMAIE